MAVVVVSVTVVAVESAIAGKRIPLLETGLSGPGLPNLLLNGIRGVGRTFSRKRGDEVGERRH